jgi:multiple sugar transport system substrate-binding protein
MKRPTAVAVLTAAALTLTACGAASDAGATDARTATGPITIWYSNNAQEVAWGEQAVAAWNADHPDQTVTAEEIPAGKSSEEVIGASIAAGNTPCLVYNTAPAAVADFQKQGGLVNLSEFEDGAAYIEERSGEAAEQFASDDGYFQMPWKSNPVVIFYNRALFEQAGIDADDPPLRTHQELLDTSRALVEAGVSPYAIYPSPSSDYYESWFDFYPFYAAESGGRQLLVDGEPTFTDEDALTVAELWRTLYADGLAGQEPYTGDAFVDGVSAMAVAGPWAVASFADKVDWGTVPVPTSAGTDAAQTATFDDAKNIGMYTSCENQATAWEFLKFTTSTEQDGKLLDATGQMPLRTDLADTYAEYFAENPQYAAWSTGRTVAVPNTLDSTEIWQTFRDAWSRAVIFGDGDIADTLDDAARTVADLAQG